MDIFEDNDVRYPRRTLQQEDEEAAEKLAVDFDEQVPIIWNRGLRRQMFPDGVIVDKMVIACDAVSCALLNHMNPDKKVLGTLLYPDQSTKGNTACPAPSDIHSRSCTIHVTPLPSGGTALLVGCQYQVLPERAHAVCKSLMAEVCPKQVIVLGSMPGEDFRGAGDPTQEPLLFRLHTNHDHGDGAASASASGLQSGAGLPPILPTGNAIGGLPAALLSYCQVRSMQAVLLVTVGSVASLAPMLVAPLAAIVTKITELQTAAVVQHACHALTAHVKGHGTHL